MKGFLRRLRGIIGTGLTWAVGFAAFNSIVALFQGGGWESFLGATIIGGFFGLVLGSGFASILSLTERHRTLRELSLPRVGLWGAIGGFLFTVAFNLAFGGTIYWGAVLTVALFSAGFSSGSVALAKRSDAKVIEGDDESALSLEGDGEPLPSLEGE
jgi:hypothetical protein